MWGWLLMRTKVPLPISLALIIGFLSVRHWRRRHSDARMRRDNSGKGEKNHPPETRFSTEDGLEPVQAERHSGDGRRSRGDDPRERIVGRVEDPAGLLAVFFLAEQATRGRQGLFLQCSSWRPRPRRCTAPTSRPTGCPASACRRGHKGRVVHEHERLLAGQERLHGVRNTMWKVSSQVRPSPTAIPFRPGGTGQLGGFLAGCKVDARMTLEGLGHGHPHERRGKPLARRHRGSHPWRGGRGARKPSVTWIESRYVPPTV